MDVRRNINLYISGNTTTAGHQPNERYTSFDYCYNYFQCFKETDRIEDIASSENIQLSCLQLAFYLASWGMLRGSSFLLQKSAKHYQSVIKAIANTAPEVWDIDVDKYNSKNIDLLLANEIAIAQSIGQGRRVSIILTTKIMLGVFGNIPAFDTYFRSGFGTHTLSRGSLRRISDFYQSNKVTIDEHCIPTIDFETGQRTHRHYPKAKLIDMIGFIEGEGV
jgi:hypothetical protein